MGDLTSPLVIERIASTWTAQRTSCSATARRTCWTSATSTRTSSSLYVGSPGVRAQGACTGRSFVCKVYQGRGRGGVLRRAPARVRHVLCAKPRCSAPRVRRGLRRRARLRARVRCHGPGPFVACGGADEDADAVVRARGGLRVPRPGPGAAAAAAPRRRADAAAARRRRARGARSRGAAASAAGLCWLAKGRRLRLRMRAGWGRGFVVMPLFGVMVASPGLPLSVRPEVTFTRLA